MAWSGLNRQGVRRLLPELTFQPHSQLQRTIAELAPGMRIADLGSGGRRITTSAICVDITPLADLVSDIHSLPLATGLLGVPRRWNTFLSQGS